MLGNEFAIYKGLCIVSTPPFYYCHHPFPSICRIRRTMIEYRAIIKTCHFPSINYTSVDYPSIAYVNIDYCGVDDAWHLGIVMALKGMVMLMR